MKYYEFTEGQYHCLICGRRSNTRQSTTSHIWKAHTKEGLLRNNKGLKRSKPSWNKGLTKETDDRVLKNSISLSNTDIPNHNKGKKASAKTRSKMSESKSLNPSGGRCKWYKVSGVKVQGTWERDFAKKNEFNED